MNQHNYPLPAGSKLLIKLNPEMMEIITSILESPTGNMTASELNAQKNLSPNTLSGHLRKLKNMGIVESSGLNRKTVWRINPVVKHNLSIFIRSAGAEE